jgi:hypothetical protein
MKRILALALLLPLAPAFAQSLDDYNVVWTSPSTNSGDSMPCGSMIGVQEMLLQTVGDKIYVLPAPKNTTVEGVWRGGKLEKLKVTPETRAKDVVVGAE